MTDNVIYVDNNATTAVAPEVFEAMKPYLTNLYGNPSSPYPFGDIANKAVAKAREQVATLLGAKPTEIIFTSCGSESDNTALSSALATQGGRRKIVTTVVEHPAILTPCKHLEEQGYVVKYLRVDSLGRLDLDEARELIDDETAIVSVMWANNETGNLYPVEALARIAHEHGALFHTDAVQATGKIPMNLAESEIDFLSVSGHKLHAPKGVGLLYRRQGTPFVPFLKGGHQERLQRAGTENVASIVGLGVAAELALAHLPEENTRLRAMRDKLEAGLLANAPDAHVNGDPEHRMPHTTNISFKYVEGESILLRLWNAAHICASSGSACSSGSLEASHVLRAMGVDYQSLHGSIRFSLSRYNTEAEVDTVIQTVPPIIRELREISPFGHE
ncbi:MAG: cysteine desulfurase NifS [Victivallales bacterium]|nr:cysteine desulfurase NifS [Victivallales bacterium]